MARGVARLAVCALAAAGCRQLFGIDDTTVGADADRGVDAGPADAPTAPWGPPMALELGSGPGVLDDDPSLTEDLLELYFNSDRGGNADIYVMRRASTSEAWGAPEVVTELASVENETSPEVSLDGRTIYFASNQGTISANLWLAQRANRALPWNPPQLLGPPLSSAAEDLPGCATADGATLFLSQGTGTASDVYLARLVGGAWTVQPVAELNTPGVEVAGCLSPDLQTLYFEASGVVSNDLFVAERDAAGTYARRPIAELNTDALDNDPWVSPDGRHMFFHSDRSGRDRIYETSR
jgi:Tol biopolymer transport system component